MKIKYFPYQPHCFAFGGFDMQMLNAFDAVKETGIDASKIDTWSRDNDFDIIHLWGIGPTNYNIIDWTIKSKKKIIATVLIPYYDTLRLKLSYLKNINSTFQKQLISYYGKIDKIVVVNDLQSNALNKYYKVPTSKIEIIPNIIEDNYFVVPVFNFAETYKVKDYILCTGNISSRKNQLNLAYACANLKLDLVLIGNILDGEKTYAQKLEELTQKNTSIKWIKELPKGSEELASAYFYCKIFALPSKDETQPISALEAAAMEKQLILNDRAYAKQEYYQGAVLARTTSVGDIETALKIALKRKPITHKNQKLFECKKEAVGESYKKVY
ncbi:glycosyltransferase family 4 protein, partial [Flavobacteriaceae bacterium]|nr:glycosyltransferase family 4 protein [Flavobacteriaceae bacterium]